MCRVGTRNGFILMVTLILLAMSAKAADMPRYGEFNYARIYTSPESGDVDGFRIVIVRAPESDYILFEEAPGAVMEALAGTPEIKGEEISFKLHSGDVDIDPITFRGKMSETSLVGVLSWRDGAAGQAELDLPRATKTSASPAKCHAH